MSEYFSKPAVRALNRLGDILIPESGEFPSFSRVGGIKYVDEMAAYAPREDIALLNIVLTILGFMPGFVLRWLMKRCQKAADSDKNGLHTVFREMNLGLRGLLFSCYYSGRTGTSYDGVNPLDLVGYDAVRIED